MRSSPPSASRWKNKKLFFPLKRTLLALQAVSLVKSLLVPAAKRQVSLRNRVERPWCP